MSCNGVSSDGVIAKLIEMGFEKSIAIGAVTAVGPSLNDAVEYVLKGSTNQGAASSSSCHTSNAKPVGKKITSSLCPLEQMRQSSILDHFQSSSRLKRNRTDVVGNVSTFGSEAYPNHVGQSNLPFSEESCIVKDSSESFSSYSQQEFDAGSDWEQNANFLLQKHFGYLSLKRFQKEALSAWLAHQDCLVLAATGSGTAILLVCYCFLLLVVFVIVEFLTPIILWQGNHCVFRFPHY